MIVCEHAPAGCVNHACVCACDACPLPGRADDGREKILQLLAKRYPEAYAQAVREIAAEQRKKPADCYRGGAVACPTCAASPGEPCTTAGAARHGYHFARSTRAAEASRGERKR